MALMSRGGGAMLGHQRGERRRAGVCGVGRGEERRGVW
jgi:hypothetical protein